MKKTLSFTLTIIMLLCAFIPYTIANADMADRVFVTEHVTIDEYSCLTPILEYHESDAGGYVVCKYRPDKVNRFLTSKEIQEMPESPKEWSTQITMDFRFDGGPWVSELGYLDNASSDIFEIEHYYQNPISETVAFVFADFSQYNPMNDIEGVYSNVLSERNGTYYIDWNKHTIEVRCLANITFGYSGLSLPWSPSTVLGKYVDTTNPNNEYPSKLPTPKLSNVKVSPDNHFISYQLFEDSSVNALISANHDVKTLVKYSINNVEASKEQVINLTHDIYTAVAIAETIKNTDVINIEIAYYDATTNTKSNWVKYQADIETESAPEFVPPPLQGDDAESVIQMKSEHKCGLCGICPTQPLNICLWMWGCMSVATIAIVVCVISIIVDMKKKKS